MCRHGYQLPHNKSKKKQQPRYQVNLTHIVNDSKKIRLKNKERHGKHKTYRRQFVTHE